jgi:large subunit ribosomal protein L24
MPRHVRKGDTVMVTAGSLKGQVGEILSINTKDDTVILKGLNLVRKNLRPSQRNPQGQQITKEAPVHISRVSPVVDGKPVRVGFQTKPDGSKVRVARHGGKVLKELGVVSPADKK